MTERQTEMPDHANDHPADSKPGTASDSGGGSRVPPPPPPVTDVPPPPARWPARDQPDRGPARSPEPPGPDPSVLAPPAPDWSGLQPDAWPPSEIAPQPGQPDPGRGWRPRRPLLFVLALAALIVAPIAGLLARDGGGDQGSGGPTSVVQEFSPTVEVAGPNLPLLAGDAPESIPDDAVGMPAPRMEGQDFEGFPVVVPVEGTATVLVFLAHWCPHCQAEFPRLLDAWITDDLPPDVRVVAVPTAQAPARPNWPPSDWMLGGETAWDEPVLLDTRDQDVARAMGVTGYPFFVVVAPDGTVAARSSGEHDAEGLAAMVDFAAALD